MVASSADRPLSRPPSPASPSVDELTVGVAVVDAELKIEHLNPSAVTCLGIFGRAEPGRPLAQLGVLGHKLAATAARALADRQPIAERALAAGQREDARRFDAVFTPLGPGEGGDRLLIELIPVSWHREMDRWQRETWQQEALERFARGLAHEIKNPLGGVRGAAQLLSRSLADPALREYTDVIVAETDRLARLVDRLQQREAPPRQQALNIHQATERVCALVRARAPEVALERDYDPSIPALVGDLDRLVQGFLNLANNALDAGAGALQIRTRIRRAVTVADLTYRNAVAVDFIDDGPGVPAEIRELVFYPLVSGRPSGSGLGLSIAQSIAIEHGGVIRLLDEPGGRTIFQWLIPLGGKQ